MDDQDFSKLPMSVSELRARREDKASKWSVRDALINTLRRIDAGEISPVNMVMVIEDEDDYYQITATPDHDKTIALLWRGLNDKSES